jgi:hypothetical protein
MVITILFSLIFGFFSFLQAVQVQLQIHGADTDKQGMVVVAPHETFQVHAIVVAGEQVADDISIKGLEKFSTHGKSRSTSITFAGSGVKSETKYVYDVSADREGKYVLGPASIRHKGTCVTSNKVNVRVTASQASSGQHQQRKEKVYSVPGGGVEATLSLDKKRVCIGEPVTVTLEVSTSGNVLRSTVEQPKFSNFLVKEIQSVVYDRNVVDGQLVNIMQKRYVLFPMQAGTQNIDPIKVNYQVQVQRKRSRGGFGNFFDDDFFSGFFGSRIENKQIASNSLELSVDSLPSHAQNADAVGNFTSFTMQTDRKEIMVNEPFVLKLMLCGKANLDTVPTPVLKLDSSARFYESKVDVDQNFTDSFQPGTKRFEFIVQVGRSGFFTIPVQSFNYFDPTTRTLKRLTTRPLTIKVCEPEGEDAKALVGSADNKRFGGSSENVAQKKENKARNDIHYIVESKKDLLSADRFSFSWFLFLLLLIFLPLLIYFRTLMETVKMLWGRYFGTFWAHKNRFYYLERELDTIIKSDQLELLYEFFLRLFSITFTRSQAMVSEGWIEHRLRQERWPEDKIQEFLNYLQECASIAFGSSHAKVINKKKLLGKAEYWFLLITNELVTEKKKGNKK